MQTRALVRELSRQKVHGVKRERSRNFVVIFAQVAYGARWVEFVRYALFGIPHTSAPLLRVISW